MQQSMLHFSTERNNIASQSSKLSMAHATVSRRIMHRVAVGANSAGFGYTACTSSEKSMRLLSRQLIGIKQ